MLETVLGLFLLVGVFTFTITLYSQSLSYLRRAERDSMAVSFADNLLHRVANWAKDPSHFRDSSWSPFANYTDPDFPGFEGRLIPAGSSHFVPCTSQERDRTPPDQVLMNDSVKRVELEIFWEGQSLFSVYTLVHEPKREVDRIEVVPLSRSPGPLPVDGTMEFRAQMYDSEGVEIPDLKFFWGVESVTGNGTITARQRDGRQATFTNVYTLPPDVKVYPGGTCRVMVSARYFGQEYIGKSELIELQRGP